MKYTILDVAKDVAWDSLIMNIICHYLIENFEPGSKKNAKSYSTTSISSNFIYNMLINMNYEVLDYFND